MQRLKLSIIAILAFVVFTTSMPKKSHADAFDYGPFVYTLFAASWVVTEEAGGNTVYFMKAADGMIMYMSESSHGLYFKPMVWVSPWE